ncbi:MAG: hypothetical protein A3K19_26610 [Lentisphaerae bacterium RIFOXYB12_FULL_65_16]|nr:MAG: hypothetical protein A3K18_18285 [Lentisphaerae bacterium RIFOXYA12_64_32]OGV86346.1 MAG: hypothetical protein A3K19_26610 [Lentisphaerae bacterium RIFOXYB12_FULL_65_16]
MPTRREYVKAAITHRPMDRVPYFMDVCGDTVDQIKAEFGCQDVTAWLDNDVQDVPVPWWNWHQLAPDWARPDTPTSRATVIGTNTYENLPDRVKAARANSDKYFLVRIYGSHFEKAYFSRGFENFLADIAGDYAFAKKLCRTIIEKNLVMLENFLALPEIDGVLLGSDWGAQRGPLMSPNVWDDLIRPGEQAEYDLIHAYGKDVWVHSCGDIQELVPRLVDMGLDVLNPIQPECMDIARLKQRFGHKLAFWGGISTQQTLPFGTPDEVKAEARRVRDLMAQNGGYIFAPAQSIQGDVPPRNLAALLEVARERLPAT